jgi:hypothetical protein
VLELLAALAGPHTETAAKALGEVCDASGVDKVGEAVRRWQVEWG